MWMTSCHLALCFDQKKSEDILAQFWWRIIIAIHIHDNNDSMTFTKIFQVIINIYLDWSNVCDNFNVIFQKILKQMSPKKTFLKIFIFTFRWKAQKVDGWCAWNTRKIVIVIFLNLATSRPFPPNSAVFPSYSLQ